MLIESEEIVAGFKKNGVPVYYVTYPDEGDGFCQKRKPNNYFQKKTLEFLDKYLKGDYVPNKKR